MSDHSQSQNKWEELKETVRRLLKPDNQANGSRVKHDETGRAFPPPKTPDKNGV